MTLKNKRIIIIGGSSGIGLATAIAAIEEGASVVIASRSQEKLDKAQKEIGSNVTTKIVDIRDDASLQAFFNNIGQFDHLQLPAAEISIGAFLDTPIDQVKQAFDGKFFGIYNTAKHAVPYLTQDGSITLFSGAASMRPLPAASALSAVTAAIEGLGRGLAVELAPLRVNTICPGVVDTPLFNMFDEPERVNFFDSFSSQLPIKRVAKAEEIAMAAIFLMKNTYATGTTLYVDGGYTLK